MEFCGSPQAEILEPVAVEVIQVVVTINQSCGRQENEAVRPPGWNEQEGGNAADYEMVLDLHPRITDF